MNANQDTNQSLIMRLPSRSDAEAWSEFIKLYEPMVYRYARRHGLQDADARELVQNVLLGVAKSIARWKPDAGKGKFRAWLFKIARNQWISMISRGRRDIGSGRTSELLLLHELADDAAESDVHIAEYRREVFRIAAARVRESFQVKTWDAFWRTAILDEGVEHVAASLCMSVGAVYIARSRVTHKLRTVIQKWEQSDEV
ncbi:MAG: sigma-70 family RNA polymerase sigma factor [Pirellula sp.]